jgi:starch synthase
VKKILFVSSEVFPLMKTGGLGDISSSLPAALKAYGQDVRVLMPAYADALATLGHVREITLSQTDSRLRLVESVNPSTNVRIWLLVHPDFSDRPGNPYLAPDGRPWYDNAERFALLAYAAVDIAMDRVGLNWHADLVHCNDWQTGLIPPLLRDEPRRPATVFTIHNMAYQGLFPYEVFKKLGLPAHFWSPAALEFYNQMSFIKGGLVFADWINTVSPTYAREIQTEEFGCGLQGLLQERQHRLLGILNGIDDVVWDPATDPHIAAAYDEATIEQKAVNKAALRRELGLHEQEHQPLIVMVGRLVQQKGIDLVIDSLPALINMPAQLAVIGSGDAVFEERLLQATQLYPGQVGVRICYDERLAHLAEAGGDMFLMPSRFEPCGLNQMYSQRYGTVPIVRRVGGLADTVQDANSSNLTAARASGIVFQEPSANSLIQALQRACALYADHATWRQLQRTGMQKDFSWHQSARHYIDLYERAIADSSEDPIEPLRSVGNG